MNKSGVIARGVMECHCIKKFDLEIKVLTEDLFLIEDNSIYSGDMRQAEGKTIEIQMQTPHDQEFAFNIQIDSRKVVSIKEEDMLCLVDGVYCMSTKSCGRPIKIKIPVFSALEKNLENLLVVYEDKEFILGLIDELNMAKKNIRYGQTKIGITAYESIKRRIENCSTMLNCPC